MSNTLRRFTQSNIDLIALRSGVLGILVLFGTYKWFDFEVKALQPLISNTWLSVLYDIFGTHGASYFLGAVETATSIALIIGFFRPIAGIAGAIMVIITGLTTVSLLFQLGMIDSFIYKDILLIGAGLTLLKSDLIRYCQTQPMSSNSVAIV